MRCDLTFDRFISALATLFVLCAADSIAPAQCLEGCLAIHTLVGEAAGDQFGWEARVLGDVDGDGHDDFIVSSPTNDGGANDAGRVYVYSGATGAELYRYSGTVNNGWFGNSINGIGDVDGDGRPDFVIGEPFVNRGRVRVYSGATGAQLLFQPGESAGDQFGFRVGGGGDVSGDGIPDILIGAIGRDSAGANSGRAYVYSGADFSLVCTVDGEDAGDQLGSSLATIGDINGDGRSEFVVGAQEAGPATLGRAYVYSYNGSSCTLLQTLSPGSPAFAFGQYFINGGKDVNGDAVPDFYVSDFNVNRAYIYSGATLSPLMVLQGDNTGGFGIGEIMSDRDNDGYAEIIMAAWIDNSGGAQAGRIYIYSGQTGAVVQTLTHNIAGATFGFDAAGIGDLNYDGRGDYLISAAWDQAQRGVTYVIAGEIGCSPCDTNCDGTLNPFDIQPFVDLLSATPPATCSSCAGDTNSDGTINPFDISGFIACLGV